MFEIKISKDLHFFGAVFRFVHTVAIQQELKKISVVDCRIRKASLDLEKKKEQQAKFVTQLWGLEEKQRVAYLLK